MKDIGNKIKVYGSAGLVAFLVSHFMANKTISFIWIFIVSFVAMILLFQVIVYVIYIITSKSKIVNALKETEKRINQMPLEEVKANAEIVLHETTQFICTEAKQSLPDNVKKLGSCFVEFFKKYQAIKDTKESVSLSWSEIGISELNSNYLRVGRNMDSFTELVTKENINCLYEIDGGEENDEEIERDRFPTIYHWILYTTASNSRSKNDKI